VRTTPETSRTLQRKRYPKAKPEPAYRLYALSDTISRAEVLAHAWRRVRANRGSPGVDGLSCEAREGGRGRATVLRQLAQDRKDKTYRAQPVRRVRIPKAEGSLRPLGIPPIRDRVAQMAVKLISEPSFAADFWPNSDGFRPRKSAHDAVDAIAHALWAGYTQVLDAALAKYCDRLPPAKLRAVGAERSVEGSILPLITLGLKAPVIGEDEKGGCAGQ
jgi:RNA-directed DNA polymerase